MDDADIELALARLCFTLVLGVTVGVLVLVIWAAMAYAQDEDYDPLAELLDPVEAYIGENGPGQSLHHVVVNVPTCESPNGRCEYHVNVYYPAMMSCPPSEPMLKRKLPADVGLGKHPVELTAVVSRLGWHRFDGFSKLRILSWGVGPATYHIASYLCDPRPELWR